jgi:hypothetical protein
MIDLSGVLRVAPMARHHIATISLPHKQQLFYRILTDYEHSFFKMNSSFFKAKLLLWISLDIS